MLYWSFAVLGVVFLALVVVGGYLDASYSLSVLASFSFWHFGLYFVVGGIVLLTIGFVGIGRQNWGNHRRLFTVLSTLLVPPLIFVTVLHGYIFAFMSAPMFPLMSEITDVTVVDANPLVLSVGVKAITSRGSRIDQAFVINSDDELVAETSFDDREWVEHESFTGLALAVLPAGSEITLTLNFNTTLPSGSYLVRLGAWSDSHGESLFAIP